jgi:hypothetical protein
VTGDAVIVKSGAPSYGRTPRALLRDEVISVRAKTLYAILDDYSDADGKAFPSRSTLAKPLGCSTDSVDRAVAELEAAGWLSREVRRKEDRSFRATLYTINWEPVGVAAPVRVPSRTGAEGVAAPMPTEEEPPEEEPQKEQLFPTADAAGASGRRARAVVDKVCDAIFDESFWPSYPRKQGKADARKAFSRAVRRTMKASPADAALAIVQASKRMANDPNLPPKDFIPYPATWLNRDGWEDEPYPPRSGGAPPARAEGEAYTGPARRVSVDEWETIGKATHG